MVPRGLLLSVLALLQRPVLAHEGGPAEPGDPAYWVKLSSIMSSEGELNPKFDESADSFELRINNPEVRSVTLTMGINFGKYTTLGIPKLFVDDKEIEYSPMTPIVYQVNLDKNENLVDRVINVKVADPKGPQGFLVKTETAHTYAIRIMQPADYSRVTLLKNLTLVGGSGHVIEPRKKFDPSDKVVEYTIDQTESYVDVHYECNKYASKTLFDGEYTKNPSVKRVVLATVMTTADVECRYREEVFSQSTVEKMYTLKLFQPVEFNIETLGLMLMVEPTYGYCVKKGTPKEPRWTCWSQSLNPSFITTFTDSHAEVSLKNYEDESFRLRSGIPRNLRITHERKHWKLTVVGGKADLSFDVEVIHAAPCESMGACPKGLVPAFVPGQEKATVCLAETCEREVDERHCCVKAVSCDAFESTANCPAGQRLKDHSDRLMCRHSVCVQSDAETCCGQEHTCSMFSPWDCPTGHALRMGTDATSRSCSGATCKRKDWSKCCKQVGSITLEAEEDMVFVDMDKGGDGLIDKDELSKDAKKLVDKDLTPEKAEKIIEKVENEVERLPEDKDDHPDGKLNQKEFKLLISHANDKDDFFDILDSNEDDKVDVEDLEEADVILNPEGHHGSSHLDGLRSAVEKKMSLYNKKGCSPIVQSLSNGESWYYDDTCLWKPPRAAGLGCFAFGTSMECRFCGFHQYPACPESHDCFKGSCKAWSGDQKAWCKQHFDFECPDFDLSEQDLKILKGEAPEGKAALPQELPEATVKAVRIGAPAVLGLAAVSAAVVAFAGVRRWRQAGELRRVLVDSEGASGSDE